MATVVVGINTTHEVFIIYSGNIFFDRYLQLHKYS